MSTSGVSGFALVMCVCVLFFCMIGTTDDGGLQGIYQVLMIVFENSSQDHTVNIFTTHYSYLPSRVCGVLCHNTYNVTTGFICTLAAK